MSTLSGRQIAQLVRSGHLIIKPFDENLVQPASYDLRLGPRILASPLGEKIAGRVIDLPQEQHEYQIQSGQMVGVLSAERLSLPLDIAGRFGIRSSFARLGINAFGGLQLDPGFRGRLLMNLLNVGPEPVRVALNMAIFSVEFQRLEEPAEIGYSGPYQDQDDFPSDQYNFILGARTTSLAEIPMLRQEVARLSVLIEELEERLPDPDEGFELRPEVKEKLLRTLDTPRNVLISPDEVRRRLNR